MATTKKMTLCHLDDIEDGKAKGFEIGPSEQDRVFVVRQGEKICAYRDICPHYGNTTLPWKKDEYLDSAGKLIVCAAHGALFEISSGKCISGPCLGEYLAPVQAKLEEDKQIVIFNYDNNSE